MRLQVSLASLLLALCLSSGAAGPLQGSGTGAGNAVGSGFGNAIGEGAKEAVSSGIQDAIGKGEGNTAFREARGDAFGDRLGEEAGRQAEDVARQGMDAARNPASWGASGGHGIFDSHGSYGGQGQGNVGGPWSPSGYGNPGGSEGSFGTNSQGGSLGQGGNGGYPNLEANAQGFVAQPGYGSVRGGSQNSGCTNSPPTGSDGSAGGSQGSSSHSGGSGSSGHDGSSGGHSGGSGGHGGGSGGHGGGSGGHGGSSSGSSHGIETSRDFDQSFSVSKGTGSDTGSRDTSGGGNRPECDNTRNEARVAGGSRSEAQESSESGEGEEAISELNSVGSEASPGVFNFDNFWKNFKSKLGFINWDALNKGQLLSPNTRALLYFRRLWEDFKRKTPFFNWKEISEGVDMPSMQKRADVANQNYYYNQQAYPTTPSGQDSPKSTPKGVSTASSSASRAQPGVLHWLKFW